MPNSTEIRGQIKPLVVPPPDKFQGYIRQDELVDLRSKLAQRMVLAISKVEQWNDWQNEAHVQHNEQLRQIEQEMLEIRSELRQEIENRKIADEDRRKELGSVVDKQKEEGWKWSLLKWLLVTVGASIISVWVSHYTK